ncbi:MAG: hypothetical protein IT364_04985 [Candidatus Hydrogenedentes bacterium]|nr:hypothetical protein [Candidatus Hydrogenedentota bacterium]
MRSRDAARVLCVGLGEGCIDLILMARDRGSCHMLHESRFDAPVLRAMPDPATLGVALRKHLLAEGIASHTAIVCVPAAWCFSTWLALPDLSSDDTRDYIATQAERCLPVPPGEVAYASSVCETAAGQRKVHIVAVPAQCVTSLEAFASAAFLKLAGITIGAIHLLAPNADGVSAVLHVGSGFVEFAVGVRGGTIALHDLGGATDSADSPACSSAPEALRELRLALHRLPPGVREHLGIVNLVGSSERTSIWIEALRDEFPSLDFVNDDGPDAGCNRPDLSRAARAYLLKQPLHPDFLPKRMSRVTQAMAFVHRRRTVSFAAAALALMLLLAAVFGVQAHRLSRLNAEHALLANRAEELRTLHDSIKQYQSWFDDEPGSLHCMRELTAAFPAEGNIWLKALRIKDRTQVTCSGNASGTGAWLSALDAVRDTQGISDLAVSNIRGESPLEFSFTYRRQGSREP